MKTPSTMVDASGQAIPTAYVPKIDKARDRLVRRLAKDAEKLSAALLAHKIKCLKEIAAFQASTAKLYGVTLGGDKNGIILTSFDGTVRIERRASETLAFDERLLLAQQLINEWLAERTAGVDHDLVTLVNKAFRNARNSGLRFGEVIRLTKLDIKGEKWLKAMTLIRESITVQSSRTHCRFYKRPNTQADFALIPLDIAQVKLPEGKAEDGRPKTEG